jgi:hypothetical protein
MQTVCVWPPRIPHKFALEAASTMSSTLLFPGLYRNVLCTVYNARIIRYGE